MTSVAAIRVDTLTKKYDDRTRALRGVTFEVRSGAIFSLLGRNGSGKTTTVRILTGLTVPTSGSAEVLGLDVVTEPAAVQSRIGVTLQEAALDEVLTGRELLVFVGSILGLDRKAAVRRADELLALFDLTASAHRPIGTYSGGMQRRIDLAAALVRRPEILFLDEPTTGLDPQSRRVLWAEIERLRDDGTTVFLTTQYLEEAEALADEIAILDGGQVIDASSPDALRSRHGRTRLRLPRARDQVAAVREVADADVRVNGGGVWVPATDPDDALGILTRLRDRGIACDDFEIRRDSLEDVFLQLTGHDASRADARATIS